MAFLCAGRVRTRCARGVSPCPVPFARSDLARVRQYLKYKLPSRVCARVRTRAHAGFLTHSFILSYIPPPTGAKFAPHECKVCTRPTADRCKVCTRHNLPCVPRPACRAVPCAGRVRPSRSAAAFLCPVPCAPWRSRRTTAGRSAMSATATARPCVPVRRTGSRPSRSAAASLCPVPCALWRSGDLPRHRLPRRPLRSRRTACHEPDGQAATVRHAAGRLAMSRTG